MIGPEPDFNAALPRHSCPVPDTRFLDNKIVFIQAVDWRRVGGVDRTVASDRLVAIGMIFQHPTRPHDSTIGELGDICKALLRSLLRIQGRRQPQTEGLALCRIQTEVAEIGWREPRSIARIGEEV